MQHGLRLRAALGRTSPKALCMSLATAAVVVGSTLAIGPGIASASSRASTAGTLEICKIGHVTGTYDFVLNNTTTVPVAAGSCVDESVAAGKNTVMEMADPTGNTILTAIAVTPPSAKLSQSIGTRKAKVSVPAGGDVAVSFTNSPTSGELKVCKVAGDPSLLGDPFSFTEAVNSGAAGTPFSVIAGTASNPGCSALTAYQAGTTVNVAELVPSGIYVSGISVTGEAGTPNTNLGAGTTSLTIGSGVNVVTYTDTPTVTPSPGWIEVCKGAADKFVTGSFNFTITSATGGSTTATVPVNGCSGDIQEPAGPVTVTEAPEFPYYLYSVAALPKSALETYNLGNGSATFTVTSG